MGSNTSGSLKSSTTITQRPPRNLSVQYRRLLHLKNVHANDSHAAHKTKVMTLEAIRVGNLPEREDPTTPLLTWIGPRSLTRIIRSSKTSRLYPALCVRMPSTWRQSADNPQELGFYAKSNKGKGKADNNKDGDNNANPGFQQSKGQIVVIFAGLPSSSNKHAGKLAHQDIMAGEPSTPKYLNWSEYPI